MSLATMSSTVNLGESSVYLNTLVKNNNLNVYGNLDELGGKARALLRQEQNDIANALLRNPLLANDYDLGEAIAHVVITS